MNVLEMKKREDQGYISYLLRGFSNEKEIRVIVHYQSMELEAILYFVDKKGNTLFLKFINTSVLFDIGDLIKISLTSKEDFFVFETSIVSTVEHPNLYVINRPYASYTLLRRLVTRFSIPKSEEAFVIFSKENITCRILDISTKGLSFISESVFTNNYEAQNVLIRLPIGIIKTKGIIRSYKEDKNLLIYGMVFDNTDISFFTHIFSYIFGNKYPDLKSIIDFSYGEIYQLFEDSGYLDLKSRLEMDASFGKVFTILSKINNLPQVTGAFVYCDEGKPISTGSALRIYDKTFLGHQLAASSSARMNFKSKSNIYLGITEFLLNNPYFEYYLTYFDAKSLWHKEMYKKICELVNNREQLIMDTIDYFVCTTREIKLSLKDSLYRCLILEEPSEFIEYANQNLESLIIRSYAYTSSEEFVLNQTKSMYNSLGLFVERRLWKIEHNQNTIAYAIAEVYSDGLNLYNLLDMCRFYIAASCIDINSSLEALLPYVSDFYCQYEKEKFNLLIKTDLLGIEADSIIIQGVHYSHLFGRIISNRQGGMEYIRLIKN